MATTADGVRYLWMLLKSSVGRHSKREREASADEVSFCSEETIAVGFPSLSFEIMAGTVSAQSCDHKLVFAREREQIDMVRGI